jgi:micrococcal nuclease
MATKKSKGKKDDRYAHGKAKQFKMGDATIVVDLYERFARVLRVVDGDTLVLMVDQGFGTWYEAKFRLAGVNTPEKFGVKKASDEYKAGVAASEFTRLWIEENADREPYETPLGSVAFPRVVIRSFDAGQGKYGRWICSVHPANGEGESLNEALVRSGHAVEVSY